MNDILRDDARIFVAGHTGLVGSAVIARLKASGLRHVLTATHGELDLRDRPRVNAFFADLRPDYVILAAGRVGGIVDNLTNPANFMDDNVAIQLNVLSAAQATGVHRLIFFGSSCMYPRECSQPMREEQLLTGKPEPTSLPYAIAKLTGTYTCLAYNKQHGGTRFLPVVPNSIYGPNDNFDPSSGHVLSALIARFHEATQRRLNAVTLWGTGAPRREFVHSADVADACLFLLQRDVSNDHLPLNIGVGSDISIKDLSLLIARIVGFDGKILWDHSKPDGAPQKLLDTTRLRSLGWEAQIGLEAGIRDVYTWYQNRI